MDTTLTTHPPLLAIDPLVTLLASSICDRIASLIDLDFDNSPRNRCRWNAVIDAWLAFRAIYGMTPEEMITEEGTLC
jgi:hypothetical protein